MKTILSIITLLINITLLTVSITNVIAAPLFMVLMILVSSTVLFFVGLDLAETTKRVLI